MLFRPRFCPSWDTLISSLPDGALASGQNACGNGEVIMKITKRILSFILSICLLLSLNSQAALAFAEEEQADGLGENVIVAGNNQTNY